MKAYRSRSIGRVLTAGDAEFEAIEQVVQGRRGPTLILTDFTTAIHYLTTTQTLLYAPRRTDFERIQTSSKAGGCPESQVTRKRKDRETASGINP